MLYIYIYIYIQFVELQWSAALKHIGSPNDVHLLLDNITILRVGVTSEIEKINVFQIVVI